MAKYLLDTNICVTILRGKYNAYDILQSVISKECYLSEITVYELLCGNELAKQKKKGYKDQQLHKFLKLFNIIEISDVIGYASK